MKQKNKEVLAWHFLDHTGMLNNMDNRVPQIGKWERALSIRNLVPHLWKMETSCTELCFVGMHASRCLIDAFIYFSMLHCVSLSCYICRVKVRGAIIEDNDKLVGLERKILWYVKLEPTHTVMQYLHDKKSMLRYIHGLKKHKLPLHKNKVKLSNYEIPRISSNKEYKEHGTRNALFGSDV
jgi:hypothetical protein